MRRSRAATATIDTTQMGATMSATMSFLPRSPGGQVLEEPSLHVLDEIELREDEQCDGDDDDEHPRRRLRRFPPSPPRWALWLDIAVGRGIMRTSGPWFPRSDPQSAIEEPTLQDTSGLSEHFCSRD